MTDKQFAEQVGLYYEFSITDEEYDLAIERFAELVRDDERAKCASDYLQDCCDAIDAARLEEREACAKLCENLAREVGNKNFIAVDQRQFCAKQIRARDNK